ncbi:alpha/beta hydrolase-fold protein [Helicobacter typhlonius]|uniref:alpha/beta hydrolase n=1 Tax=Helicobacter typhlonius TaxID=76936 RepID=UPI002FE3B7C1
MRICKITILIVLLCSSAFGAPSQEISPITQEAKALFAIESIRLQNTQGRFYNIYIAIPKHKKDKTSVFYMLDGNAFFPLLLNEIAKKESTQPFQSLPIIVGIGHDSTLAFDRASRTYDYTPLLSKELRDSFSGGGGINIFLDFITQKVQPLIHKRFGIPHKELLFGHSFGGLFVLYTLLHKPQSFSHYVCASPSLWWGEGKFITLPLEITHYPDSIIFTRGSLEANSQRQAKYKIEEIVQALQKSAPNPKSIVFVELMGQNHGSSIPYALNLGLDTLMQ